MIKELLLAVKTEFPDAEVTLDLPPSHPDGAWWLDIQVGAKHLSAIWSPERGFGINASEGPGYGEGPDETFDQYDSTWARLKVYIGAARDNPENLMRYVRMLTFMGNADSPTDVTNGAALYLGDPKYPRGDIFKARRRILQEKFGVLEN